MSDFDGGAALGEEARNDSERHTEEGEVLHMSRAELVEAIREALTELKVYVLESEITEAQEAVRSVVEQATL